MKKTNRSGRSKELKIVMTSAALVCLCLTLLGLSTSAWFYHNTNVNSDHSIQLDGRVSAIDSAMVFYYDRMWDFTEENPAADGYLYTDEDYQYTSEPGDGELKTSYTSFVDGDETKLVTIKLGAYDTIFTNKNKNTGAIYKFVVSGVSSDCGLNVVLSLPEVQSGTVTDFTSFKVLPGDSNYSDAESILKGNTLDRKEFISGSTKNDRIVFQLSKEQVAESLQGDSLTVWILADYNPPSFESIVNYSKPGINGSSVSIAEDSIFVEFIAAE